MTQKYDKLVHFSKAKSLLENDDLQSIRYACLELRYFIEAHVYERLFQELDILPKTVIETWQPNKAIKFLAMFDDLADKDLVLKVFDENEEKEIVKIEYNNITIKELNKLYNSLGSYLHLPMPKKVSTYKINKNKVSSIVSKLERVTKGNLMIVKQNYEKFPCEACGSDIVFTRKYAEENESIKCQNDDCGIEYCIRTNESSVEFGAKYEFDCGICSKPIAIFYSYIEDLYSFSCGNCEAQYQFELTLNATPKQET
ncbi:MULTISPECIES: hypothetical protein [Vibrio harveyi group]|uniref:hypothetical protein n=1 Tax=Vibrio harveyi group TaxID=717610 RepID=UPI0011245FB6|nr:hypothetical protein [Vibrio parahaemolyticus]MCS0330624.1 hypothetical protein [Vibrio diabolicus]QLE25993.1 hypothetical protein FDP11_10090 [Vibrio parahaemolyticus]TOQ48821.1 hypothetical protein CGG94_22560 [Vibrio parahaemolyticus]TPA09267.1 hypothetical protein DXE05_22705 [Vibrio parahaemolyticus]HBC3607013.1 hypothetical protein [Vibrio parahaemolyticus]